MTTRTKKVYKWEKECLEKYGEEVTQQMIKMQKDYEAKKGNNDCSGCGTANEGAIVEMKPNEPFLMHYGLWSRGRCNYCGRQSN
ncbi:hypothetical protein [Priestia megaterium]|uniref:hypothetical protein n=1 Tax=Priestia megaterium TaxID=1404 RepID=UPI002877BE3F|nr:hypothetical protein [Priestia megaterium]